MDSSSDKSYDESSTTISNINSQQQEQQRQKQRNIICRCCLLEEQNLEQGIEMTKYVSLDTAMLGCCANQQPTNCNSNSENESSTPTPQLLLDCLNMCTQIEAKLDEHELPAHICIDCYQALEASYDFICCVRNADKILRAKYKQQKQQAVNEGFQIETASAADDSRVFETSIDENLLEFCSDNETTTTPINIAVNDMPTTAVALASLQLPLSSKAITTTAITITLPLPAAGQEAIEEINEKDNRNDLLSKQTKLEQKQDTYQSSDDFDNTEGYLVKSFDSGIEVDDDLIGSELNDCTADAKFQEEDNFTASNDDYMSSQYEADDDLKYFSHCNTTATCASSRHKCGFCAFQCYAKERLQTHLQSHLGPPRYKCNICTFACHFKYFLAQHKRNAHHLFESKFNDMNFENKTFLHKIKYRCNICNLYLTNLTSLQEHIKIHESTFYQCAKCSFEHSKREVIVEHMAKEHRVFIDKAAIAHYIPAKIINTSNNHDCSSSSTSSIKFKQPKRTLLNRLHKPLKLHVKHKKHLCQFCGKSFERKLHVLNHEYRMHKKDIAMEALKYKISNKSSSKYAQLQYMRQRKAAQKAERERLRCTKDKIDDEDADDNDDDDEEYGFSENSKANEILHGKFHCKICPAEFLFNFELKYHMRTHINVTKSLNTVNTVNTTTIINRTKVDTENLTKANFEKMQITAAPPTSASLQEKSTTHILSLPSPDNYNSTLSSSTASPESSISNFDIDDLLYLNDFDLDLLNC